MSKKTKMSDFTKYLQRFFTRFMNYTRHQKAFVLFLFVFAFAVLCFPILKVSSLLPDQGASSIWLFSGIYFKSFLVVLLAFGFLFGWNLDIKFKSLVVKCFGFRETEPVLNFMFLWMIGCVYMGILDTIGLTSQQTGLIALSRGLILHLGLLVIGLGITIVEIRKSANQNSQKTKILNIVDEEAPKKPENKRVLQHLFDDEELE